MALDHLAHQDFERAVARAFWRKIVTFITGESNDLLPFEEVRERLAMRGQHYIGLKQVPIDKIIGSLGRYKDFDRAFLPRQSRTKERWVSIDKAHYQQVTLPPVELYKLGEIYFVKDGNHRVSVARERGQEFVDAYVIEIDFPVVLSPDVEINDLLLKQELADFLIATGLHQLRPQAQIEASIAGLYTRLFEHISVHRWYLGIERGDEVPYPEAVTSWYDHVYLPLVERIREEDILKSFPGTTETDLYLWIMEYQGLLKEAFRSDESSEEIARAEAAQFLLASYPLPAVRQLITFLNSTTWLDGLLLSQEKASFYEDTRVQEIRPEVRIECSLHGQYDKLRSHIAVHQWYLGEQRGSEVSSAEAVASWVDNIYLPLAQIIREQDILKEFPGRTETDLYLWIIEHRANLRETYGDEVPLEKAAEQFAGDFSQRKESKVIKAIKKVTGKK